jgi:hypothetical protein
MHESRVAEGHWYHTVRDACDPLFYVQSGGFKKIVYEVEQAGFLLPVFQSPFVGVGARHRICH